MTKPSILKGSQNMKPGKYVYTFTVATNYVGSKVTDHLDLVNDLGLSEAELDAMTEDEFQAALDEQYEIWVWEQISGSCYKTE